MEIAPGARQKWLLNLLKEVTGTYTGGAVLSWGLFSKNDARFGSTCSAWTGFVQRQKTLFTEVVRAGMEGFPKWCGVGPLCGRSVSASRSRRAQVQRIGINTQTGWGCRWYNEVQHPQTDGEVFRMFCIALAGWW
jgi:hypothetical protein